jgi:alkylhydroperoxidase family enzyme
MSSVPRTSITLADAAPGLAAAQAEFQAVAYPGAVDLVTRELLRILSGRLSHCSICRNLRLQAAIDRGFDESMVAHLEDPSHSDLPERQQVVLRLTRAFLTDPQSFTPADREVLARHYSQEQIAELLLDLVRFRPGSMLTVAGGREPAADELVYA